MEQRLIEIRLNLIKKYNETAFKYNIPPIEIEEDGIDEMKDIIENTSNTDFSTNTEDMGINIISIEAPIECKTELESAILPPNVSEIQLISGQRDVEGDIVVEDYNMDRVSLELCNDSQDSIEHRDGVTQEYFDEESENMEEIVIENGK